MANCKKCKAEIIWLKCQKKDGEISDKPHPIDAEPNYDEGNLVISKEKGLYRHATGNEKEVARLNKKGIYTSHFMTCPNAEEFRT